ncbi:MAG: HAMP domain-containing histidine kinase [Kiritimatiellae bacterium]|nr:HAMP domain-containing histidine kinase [Kiritimatiellia bacterium]
MKSFLRTYLLCIALPALLLALLGAALIARHAELLRRERAERLAEAAGRTAAETLDGIRNILDDRLDRIRSDRSCGETLVAIQILELSDRFVRNAFLWRPGEGFVHPAREGATAERRAFLARCESRLADADPWGAPDAGEPERGVRPWPVDGRDALLGWVRLDDGSVAGIELETVAWLADRRTLDPPLPPGRKTGPALAAELLDEDGAVLLPSLLDGLVPVQGADAGEATLAPLFPRWRVRVRSADPDAASRLAFWTNGVLLGLLLLAFVAGGYVLLRAARRERLDSLRKTDFVSNVSHELRTPLTSIRMFSELLAEDRIPDPARRRHALGTMAAESARLSRLVDSVLDFSRLEQSRRKYVLEPVDLAELLDEMQNAQCTMQNGEGGPTTRHSSFVTRHCDDAAVALADRDAVRQIVLNLLDNAEKYAAAGGPPEVSVRDAGNGVVALAVADRGPGVPPRAAKRIFDRFYRADDATTAETRGSGLGLSIARRLARGMRGDLTYRPRPGGGSVFELTLPKPPSVARPGYEGNHR